MIQLTLLRGFSYQILTNIKCVIKGLSNAVFFSQLWKIKSWQRNSVSILECFYLLHSHFVQFTNYLFTHTVFLLRVYLNSRLCSKTQNAMFYLSIKSVIIIIIISINYYYHYQHDGLGSQLHLQQFSFDFSSFRNFKAKAPSCRWDKNLIVIFVLFT